MATDGKKTEKTRKKQTSDAKKPKTSMRDSAAKSRAKAEKPKRVRQATTAATKPVSALGRLLTKEIHIINHKNKDGFFTKSRSLMPSYFLNSWKELQQVTWPKRRETWRLVFAVFMFAIIMGVAIAILDYGLEKLLREVIL